MEIMCISEKCNKKDTCLRWVEDKSKSSVKWFLKEDECINASKYGTLRGDYAFYIKRGD
jgi:hypothetical protein